MATGAIPGSKTLRAGAAALCLWLLAACAQTHDWRSEPVNVERDFRNSVEQMRMQQNAHPSAAFTPAPEPLMGLAGEKAEQVFSAYRKDVSKPQEVQREINFNIFTGGR